MVLVVEAPTSGMKRLGGATNHTQLQDFVLEVNNTEAAFKGAEGAMLSLRGR